MHKNITENISNNSDAYLRNLLHKFVLVCEEVQFVGSKSKLQPNEEPNEGKNE